MKIRDFFEGFVAGQKTFGENISVITNSILLSIVYFFGVGPISIIAKIFRKNFLDLKPNKNARTYWLEINLDKKSLEQYYKQF